MGAIAQRGDCELKRGKRNRTMDASSSESNPRFLFLEELTGDLNRGDIELPSFPDVVLQIRKALEDENCSTENWCNS